MTLNEITEKFLQSGYDIDGKMYYSFQQIGNYLFPDKIEIDAENKVRYIYRYRKADLEKYAVKTKSKLFKQTIVVLDLEGVKALCGFVKKSESSERLGNLLFRYNFS